MWFHDACITDLIMADSSILYVEDNLGDYVLVERFLADRYPKIQLSQAINGALALKRLEELKSNPSRLPTLILLDINLPVMDGIETLEKIRADEALRLIPVIIFTSSGRSEDISRSYERKASGYVTKASGIREYHQNLDAIIRFWLQSACLPGNLSAGFV